MDTEEKKYYITKNEQEYGKYYPQLNWVEPEQAAAAAEKRGDLIRQCGNSIHSGYKGSKLYTHKLSPGCRHCGGGTWSCLFINGFCRAGCFFCPSSQNTMGQPITNSILFPKPAGYIDYIEKFNIQGVSLSGGEPLASLERSLVFLREIKSHFRDKVYFWLYTNDRLISREKLLLLKEAGLNEIRFNIAADAYRLLGVKTAAEIIDKVTVEIPAVPEDEQRLIKLLPVLKKTGISFLNLHQLRLTPFNLKKMLPRRYTYLHGPKVTVMESELTALAVMRERQIPSSFPQYIPDDLKRFECIPHGLAEYY